MSLTTKQSRRFRKALGSLLLAEWSPARNSFVSVDAWTAQPVDQVLNKKLPPGRQQRISEAEALAVWAALEAQLTELKAQLADQEQKLTEKEETSNAISLPR